MKEVPAASDRWSTVGLMLIAFAPEFALASLAASDRVVRAVLLTLAVCLFAGGAGCLVADHDVNRGRRSKRSRLVEEIVEEDW